MEPTGAVTREAQNLNPTHEGISARDWQLDDRVGRMDTYANLPDGRLWDEQHAAHVRNQGDQWGPFNVLRQQLIEAGWRAIGPNMLLSQQEKEQYFRHLDNLAGKNGDDARTQAQQQGSGITPYPRPH